MTTKTRVVSTNNDTKYDYRVITTDGTMKSKGYKRQIVSVVTRPDGNTNWSHSFCKWCEGNADVLASLVKAENRLRDRLVNQLGPSSSIGTAIFAERVETIETLSRMVRGAHQLIRAMTLKPSAISDLINRSAHFRSLGFAQYSKADWGRHVAKRAGQYQLEYAWNLAPLFDDIYNTVLALQQPMDDSVYSIRASAKGPTVVAEFGDNGSTPWGKWHASVGMGAGMKFTVSNPILYTAARVGLVNPAEWAWEAIPFSWLADQFTRLGSVISSWDDFVGINIVDAYTTFKIDASEDALVWTENKYEKAKYTYTCVEREPRVPVARMELVYNPITSLQRALNDISFLTNFLNDPVRVRR